MLTYVRMYACMHARVCLYIYIYVHIYINISLSLSLSLCKKDALLNSSDLYVVMMKSFNGVRIISHCLATGLKENMDGLLKNGAGLKHPSPITGTALRALSHEGLMLCVEVCIQHTMCRISKEHPVLFYHMSGLAPRTRSQIPRTLKPE